MTDQTNVWKLFDLTGKVFLVVGGARDLGYDMALALAEAHADGAITSRTQTNAEAAANQIADTIGQERRIIGLGFDATDEADVQHVIDAVMQQFGRIDVLVNNVGGVVRTSDQPLTLEERRRQDWDELMTRNVTTLFLLCKHIASVMKKQGSGSIINLSSIAGIVGRDRRMYAESDLKPQEIDYAAAKGAVLSMTRDLAAYLGPHGIRVNAISPGGFERGQPKKFIDLYSRRTMLGRMGRDGVDLKGAVVFLASEASAYVTGHNLVVDGGFSVWQ